MCAMAALAMAAFVVSLGYGALLPALPGWLSSIDPTSPVRTIAQYVGEPSGIYMLRVFVGALAAVPSIAS
jgi:hypothetical protein